MYMLALFTRLCFSGVMELTKYNEKQLFNNSRKLPSLVLIWSQWCKHCKEFQDDWGRINSDSRWRGRVLFGSVNCEMDSEFCDTFEGNGTPQLLWYTFGTRKGFQYVGVYSEEHVTDFIERQLVAVYTPFEDEQKMIESDPAFLFNISIDDAPGSAIVKNVCRDRLSLGVNCFVNFVTGDEHNATLKWFSRRGREVDYDGEWNPLFIGEFMDMHILPSLGKYSDDTKKVLQQLRKPTFLFVPPLHDSQAKLAMRAASEAVDHLAPALVANCKVDPYICRYVDRWPGERGTIVLLGDGLYDFWVYDGEMEEGAVKEWAHKALNRELPALGPGQNSLMYIYYDLRAAGGAKYYLLYSPIVAVIVVILVLLFSLMPKSGTQKSQVKTE